MSALQCVCVTEALLAVLIGYLLGSLPIADFVSRRYGGPNLRDVGDHNPGFWNSRAVLPRNASLTIFVGDLAKGVVSVVAAQAMSTDWRVWYLAAGGAMVGHAWPIFARFSGGRSVLAWAGAAIVLSPLPAGFAVLMVLLFWAATREFSHAVRIGVVLFPFAQWYQDGPWRTAATGLLMSIIGVRFAMASDVMTSKKSFADRFASIRAAAPLARRRNRAANDDKPRE
jgi:glycerol-3-phosphate acyltransferase PlsY